jgi:hypothetical protein
MRLLKQLKTICAVAALSLFAISCHKASPVCLQAPTTAPLSPNVNFRVVDKTTGTDLFFGAGAIYTPSQLKFSHILNGQPDTVYLMTNTADRFFNIRILPAHGAVVHYADTVTMQIANKPQDVFLFNTKDIISPCYTTRVLVSVEFNGKVIFTPENGPNVAVLMK